MLSRRQRENENAKCVYLKCCTMRVCEANMISICEDALAARLENEWAGGGITHGDAHQVHERFFLSHILNLGK